MARAEEAGAGYGTAGDHWGVAVSSLVRAQGAVHAGEVSTVAILTAEILRHSEAIARRQRPISRLALPPQSTNPRDTPGSFLGAPPACCCNGPGSHRSWGQ
jgi:hypothetical protein